MIDGDAEFRVVELNRRVKSVNNFKKYKLQPLHDSQIKAENQSTRI